MQSENASKKRLSTVIREEMVRAGLSITELADKTGLKRPYLSLRLNGHRGFNAADLDRIGRVLDVPGWELMYRARGGEVPASSVGSPARDSGGYAIQDEASGVVLLEGRHVALDGGDAA
ncbi:helix-turn-helix domain-containing protein [Kytococcus sedentarius]|uniref:helix-turn-helix domain-containing protein n=1 Tax=Kytococcus sedentarius TaxID=1276 RepID=UPI00065F84F5|nr:helix-turn-helix transcriptional regulator [Kytococcus sedentarius]